MKMFIMMKPKQRPSLVSVQDSTQKQDLVHSQINVCNSVTPRREGPESMNSHCIYCVCKLNKCCYREMFPLNTSQLKDWKGSTRSWRQSGTRRLEEFSISMLLLISPTFLTLPDINDLKHTFYDISEPEVGTSGNLCATRLMIHHKDPL